MSNTVLCGQCGKLIHGICVGVKRVNTKYYIIFFYENMKGILQRLWSRKKNYVMKWKQQGNSHILVTG